MPRGPRRRHAIFHEQQCGAQLFLIERGTARFAALGSGSVHTVASAFGDEPALELCDGPKDVEHQLAGGRRCVDFLLGSSQNLP